MKPIYMRCGTAKTRWQWIKLFLHQTKWDIRNEVWRKYRKVFKTNLVMMQPHKDYSLGAVCGVCKSILPKCDSWEFGEFKQYPWEKPESHQRVKCTNCGVWNHYDDGDEW